MALSHSFELGVVSVAGERGISFSNQSHFEFLFGKKRTQSHEISLALLTNWTRACD